MNKKLIDAESYYCKKSNLNVVLKILEEDIVAENSITENIEPPPKGVRFFECLSSGSNKACSTCPNK